MRTLVFILALIAMLCGYMVLSSNAQDYTFDIFKNLWRIDVAINGEPEGTYHFAESVLIDNKTDEVIVLYPNDKKSVRYKASEIKEVVFKNLANGHQFSVNPSE